MAQAIFDAANRLLEDEEFTYTYDANGNLIQKTDKLRA
ncbi:RHS repeat protein [Acidobacteria bacterium AH-259-L09]|nr:RHS repeat protein [Acidobacteria bacterium AH-259-L09]